MAKKASQTDHYEHSEIKIKLLKNYLQAYLSVIGHSPYFNVIHLYDLFCGEGLYPNGGKGSPIIITETIREIQESSSSSSMKNTRFNFTASDNDLKTYQKVKEYFQVNSDELKWLASISIQNRDYKDFLPTLSSKFPKLRGEKAFVFIDPYGYQDISIIDIMALLKGKNSEVLLFLPTQFMYRFDNHAAPPSLIKFLEEMDLQIDWLQIENENGLDFIEKLKKGFSRKLGTEYFVDTFVIARDKNEFFCLFFFTSHIYGFEKMLEAKWRIDEEEGRGWKPDSYIRESKQLDIFSQNETEININPLEKSYIGFFKDWRTNKEIYEFTLNNSFLPKHANIVLRDMLQRGVIEKENIGTFVGQGTHFYPNYSSYKKGVDPKIRVRLNKNK